MSKSIGKKRAITVDEFDVACVLMNQLTEILLAVGIVEVKISKKEKEIFWDTENRGKIDPVALEEFSNVIESHYLDLAQRTATK